MTAVITVPASLDEQSFEQVLEQVAPLPADAKLLVDARHTRFATPYGLTGLLCLAQSRAEKADFAPPADDEVKSYWSRSSFFRYAEELFTMRGTVPKGRVHQDSDTVLEVTPIAKSEDVHTVVERVKDRATHILTNKLKLETRATMGFTVSLSEACQNIVEHAGRGGWVGVQVYNWAKRRVGRQVVVIAVADAGQGFRQSLSTTRVRALAGDRWGDGEALEAAVTNGYSRHTEPGRGQGIRGIKGYVHRHDGRLSIRSGTSRVTIVPPWDDSPAREDGLPAFVGAQLQIIIPERAEGS
ncbi:ATP-binding protein [Pseudogemmatithrix spongiicola]|uniref:ATP-binding protein n=1 Tax=Pseudogemmatithrix spongiicola TaxID=3062599 RepID=A0AA49Q5D1_9BACT|nr:ATP-binding protein [Gemmatimonadaceae bacterium 'strain 138']WKW15608.1 ATP-binding protein [Gemmatimonadaceae bacterium 'strain 318']